MSIEVNSYLSTANIEKAPQVLQGQSSPGGRDIKKDMMENFFLVEKVH